MTAFIPKPQDIYDIPIDALDAAFMLHCHDNASIYTSRREEIPGKLIIYSITGAKKASQNKLIGEVRFQFVSSDRSRISFETPQPFPPTWESLENWVDQDYEYLKRICMTVIGDLKHSHSSNKINSRSNLPGKPSLPQDDLIFRIASALLEEYLKKKDKGMTRGEVVVIAYERLNHITTTTEIKDGKRRLGDANHNKDQALLDSAQEQLDIWLNKLYS
jgi:hypothetical protein